MLQWLAEAQNGELKRSMKLGGVLSMAVKHVFDTDAVTEEAAAADALLSRRLRDKDIYGRMPSGAPVPQLMQDWLKSNVEPVTGWRAQVRHVTGGSATCRSINVAACCACVRFGRRRRRSRRRRSPHIAALMWPAWLSRLTFAAVRS
eukprot:COSAG01_NODE_16941_length_1192_cov_0.882891_3_plen_147_part_00